MFQAQTSTLRCRLHRTQLRRYSCRISSFYVRNNEISEPHSDQVNMHWWLSFYSYRDRGGDDMTTTKSVVVEDPG